MKWSVIRPKVLEVIGLLAGIETYWRDRERAFVAPGSEAVCLLRVIQTNNTDAAGDEIRQTYNPTTNKIDLCQAGNRAFTVSVLVESYNQADDKTALEYLSAVQDGLMRPQIAEMFREEDLAIVRVSATTDLSHDEDEHAVSSASLDVFFAYANSKTAADGAGLESLDWIEQVGGEGTGDDPGGLTPVTPVTADVDP